MKSDYTKKLFADSLKKLLIKKQITKITISDLAEECGISRMTFYYHFKDIYDLAEWTLEDSFQQVVWDHPSSTNWQQELLILLNNMKENQSIILNLTRSIDRITLERYLLKKIEKHMLFIIDEQSAGISISVEGKSKVAIFYTYALIGVVLDWIEMNMKTSPQELVSLTAAIIRGDFRNSLKNVSQLEQKMKIE